MAEELSGFTYVRAELLSPRSSRVKTSKGMGDTDICANIGLVPSLPKSIQKYIIFKFSKNIYI